MQYNIRLYGVTKCQNIPLKHNLAVLHLGTVLIDDGGIFGSSKIPVIQLGKDRSDRVINTLHGSGAGGS